MGSGGGRGQGVYWHRSALKMTTTPYTICSSTIYSYQFRFFQHVPHIPSHSVCILLSAIFLAETGVGLQHLAVRDVVVQRPERRLGFSRSWMIGEAN